MNALILDSSTKNLYVCLVIDDNIIYEKYIEGRNDHAKNIVFRVDEALKTANIEVDKLNKIIVGNGPGSYTGVRMAVSVCKMIAVFKKIDLYTISTLRLMASGYKGIIKASIDARRGNAFSSVINTLNDEIILEDGLYSYDELNEIEADYSVDENEFKVDPIYCINNATKVLEPHLLVPNYLRDTEAERNLKWLELYHA